MIGSVQVDGNHRGVMAAIRTVKVLHVMGNNITAACGKSQFQNHVVIGVGKKWPPKKMDLLQMSLVCQIAKRAKGVVLCLPWRQILASRHHCLPLDVKRD